MMHDLIPALDSAGVPGPLWLFHGLLVLTFFLHILFVNLTLGGTILAAIAHYLSGGRSDDPRATLARRLMTVNNYGISLTITTGIAPLLFIQVIYQQFFYTATILIGCAWFAFLIALAVGYYAAYFFKFRSGGGTAKSSVVWLTISAVMFLFVAAIHVVVSLVHAQPERWAALSETPWSILGDPTFVPRFLHFLVAGIGFSALVVAWWAVRQAVAGRDLEMNSRIARFAWKWVLWTTLLQVIGGFLLLIVLPKPVVSGLISGGAAMLGPLTLAIILSVGLLVMISKVSDPVASASTVTGVLATVVLTIAVMVITRHQVRALYLQVATQGNDYTVVPQWGTFVLFAVSLVAGLLTVAYVVRRVVNSPAAGDEAA